MVSHVLISSDINTSGLWGADKTTGSLVKFYFRRKLGVSFLGCYLSLSRLI